jgi:hypothetical protein
LLEKNETTTKVNADTYQRFFFADKLNCLLLPLAFMVLVISELIILAFLRILADYKNVQAGKSDWYAGDFTKFWGVLGFLAFLNLIFLVLK